jgi:hypothetical protein
MLKTVSSITNAIGALNFKGTWDANANSPALASSVGTKGDYYVVGTAGTTNLNGISTWGVGDWATFNGSVWQRVEGGADLNGVNLSVSGTSQLIGNATFSDNLIQGTATKGVNFTANTPAAGMTSQLLNWYEEGTFTPTITPSAGSLTSYTSSGFYTRIGNTITVFVTFMVTNGGTASGNATIGALPFASKNMGDYVAVVNAREGNVTGGIFNVLVNNNATTATMLGANWSTNAKYVFAATYLLA